MAERGGQRIAGFRRRRPLPLGGTRAPGFLGAGGARGLVRGLHLVKITTTFYVAPTLQEMVSPDPQIIVVAPGAEPASTQGQRAEDGGTIIRIFWVGPQSELLRRAPVSSVLQVGLERGSPPCSSLFGQARPGRPALPTYGTWRPPRRLPGSRAAPGGARALAAARGAAPARAGGGFTPGPRPGTTPYPAGPSGTRGPRIQRLATCARTAARACDTYHPGRPASPRARM